MKKRYIICSLMLFSFLHLSCQRNWGKYVYKSNYCNGFEISKSKVLIEIKKDTTYQITTTKKSNYTDWEKETKTENGRWVVNNDTLIVESTLL